MLPQFLKILPVYINSLRKSEVLLPSLRSSVHQRLQLRSSTVVMDTRSTIQQLYPLTLPLVGRRESTNRLVLVWLGSRAAPASSNWILNVYLIITFDYKVSGY